MGRSFSFCCLSQRLHRCPLETGPRPSWHTGQGRCDQHCLTDRADPPTRLLCRLLMGHQVRAGNRRCVFLMRVSLLGGCIYSHLRGGRTETTGWRTAGRPRPMPCPLVPGFHLTSFRQLPGSSSLWQWEGHLHQGRVF